MTRWIGEDGWEVEIDRDCFDPDGPVLVTIDVGDFRDGVLATPSSEQAREMARALLAAADEADRSNGWESG